MCNVLNFLNTAIAAEHFPELGCFVKNMQKYRFAILDEPSAKQRAQLRICFQLICSVNNIQNTSI